MNQNIKNLKELKSNKLVYYKLFYFLEYLAKLIFCSLAFITFSVLLINEGTYTISVGISLIIFSLILFASIYNDFINKLDGVDNK